jgi:hypothetical protein
MTVHRCPDCRCADDDPIPQPSTSSPGIRRAVIEQTAAEVRRVKERRLAAAKGEK